MKAFAIVLFFAAACSPFDPDLGNAPYKCGDVEPRCPEGYTCNETDPDPGKHVCTAPGGLTPDGGTIGFQCLDDSPFGANDTTGGAFVTPVASSNQSFTGRAAVCPELDKDHYAFNVTVANSNVEVVTDWENGMPVNTSILNQAGTSIGNATPMGELAVRVCVPNLPIGNYYVSIFAASSIKNNYRFVLTIVPNC